MKFGVMFANVGPFGQAEGLTHLAQTAERVASNRSGRSSTLVVRRLPVAGPYAQSGKMPGPESRRPRPAGLALLRGGVTKEDPPRDRHPDPPQRNPVYVANEVATLDQLSGGGAIRHRDRLAARGVPRCSATPSRSACAHDESIKPAQPVADGPSRFDGAHSRWEPLESKPSRASGRRADRGGRPHAGRGEARRAPSATASSRRGARHLGRADPHPARRVRQDRARPGVVSRSPAQRAHARRGSALQDPRR